MKIQMSFIKIYIKEIANMYCIATILTELFCLNNIVFLKCYLC